LKILFCNYEYPPLGGGGGVARELARRHEVTVLTSQALGLEGESTEGSVRIIRVPVFFRRQLAVANFPSMLAFLPSATLNGIGLTRFGPIRCHQHTFRGAFRPGRAVPRSRQSNSERLVRARRGSL
jgi:hypothetical protein